MKKILFLLALVAAQHTFCSAAIINLSDAIKNKSVNAEGINTQGRYKGKTTTLTITNNTQKAMQVRVDVGTILKPEIEGYQPMVLPGNDIVMLSPGGKGDVEVETFCGNSPLHCPAANLHYSYSHVGSDTLVKVLQFLAKNNVLDYLAQDMVWVVTNHMDIAAIYAADTATTRKYHTFLCSVTGRPMPIYHKEVAHYEQVPDVPAYIPKTLKITADFEITLEAQKTLTLGVYDDSGHMVQKVFENQQFGKPDRRTGQRFGVEFEAEGQVQGKYFIRLKEGDMVLQEKMVEVD